MTQEINEDTYIIWSEEEPSAVVMEVYRDRICFTQNSDMIDIDFFQMKKIVKLFTKILKENK